MALAEYRMPERYGALYIVENSSDKDWIDRRLKQLDPHLFCEMQKTYDGEFVWCVVEDIGLDHPPVTVMEFRDEMGRPIPFLSDRLVDQMHERRREIERHGGPGPEGRRRLVMEIDRKNQDKREANRAKMRETMEQAQAEWSAISKRSGTVHRSQALRQSRDRMRARGHNV